MHEIAQVDQLLPSEKERVRGDAGYRGIEKSPEHEGRDVGWQEIIDEFFSVAQGKLDSNNLCC